MSEFTRLLQAREQFDSESEFARLKAMSWQQESSGGALVKPPSRVRVRALRKRYKAMRMGHIIKCMDGSANHGKPGPCPKPKAPKPQASSRPQAAPEPVAASSHSHSSEPQAAPVTTKDSWKGVKKVAIALGITAAAVGVGVLAWKNPAVAKAIWDKLKAAAEAADDVAGVTAKVSAVGATAVAVANRLKQDDLVDPDNGVPEKVTRQLAQDMGDEVRYRYAVDEIKKAKAEGRDPHPESVNYLSSLREKARKGIEDGTISKEQVERALNKVDVTISYDDIINHIEEMGKRPAGEKAYMDAVRSEPFEKRDRDGTLTGGRLAEIEEKERISGKAFKRRVVEAMLKHPEQMSKFGLPEGVLDTISRYHRIDRGDLPRDKRNQDFMNGGFENAILSHVRIGDFPIDGLTFALTSVSEDGAGTMSYAEFYDTLMHKPKTPRNLNTLTSKTSARSRASEKKDE